MEKNTAVKKVAIDIRHFCETYGIDIAEEELAYPVVGVSKDGPDGFSILLHEGMTEPQKRVVIASMLATCLSAKAKVGCLMTEERDTKIAAMARQLLMPEQDFRRESERLAWLGCLRPSALAVQFDVPLCEVLSRAHDLNLD